MNSEEIVNKFVKCQTEKQIERTYYIFLDCKKDLIYDIEYSYNYYIYILYLILISSIIYNIDCIFKPLISIMKWVYNLSLYLVGYYKDNTHDRIHKLEHTIININDDLNEYLKVLDNKFFNDEYVNKLSYDREILNIRDRLYILENIQ